MKCFYESQIINMKKTKMIIKLIGIYILVISTSYKFYNSNNKDDVVSQLKSITSEQRVDSNIIAIHTYRFKYKNSQIFKVNESFSVINEKDEAKSGYREIKYSFVSNSNPIKLVCTETNSRAGKSSMVNDFEIVSYLLKAKYEITKFFHYYNNNNYPHSRTDFNSVELDEKGRVLKLLHLKSIRNNEREGTVVDEKNNSYTRCEYDDSGNLVKEFRKDSLERLSEEYTYDNHPNPRTNLGLFYRMTDNNISSAESINNKLTAKIYENGILFGEQKYLYEYDKKSNLPLKLKISTVTFKNRTKYYDVNITFEY